MKKISLFLIVTCFLLFSATESFAAVKVATDSVPSMIERIDPELQSAFIESRSLDFEKVGVEPFREYFSSLVNSTELPSDSEVKVYNVNIKNPDTGKDLRLRIYEPINRNNNRPGIYWMHGGGFIFGVPEQDEAQSIRFAKEVGAVVVAVDYRLAPEYPYPAALNDSYAGLVWFAENANELGVDKSRIAVAGASAGGGLCASVALLARDRGGPLIAFQMPLYPMIDDRFITSASQENIDMRVWNNTSNRYAWHVYLGDLAQSNEVTPYMAPARATDLSGLPPTYTCVGTLDPFRDDTINYASRLAQAGVATELHLYPGAYHAFEIIAPNTSYSKRVVDEYVYVLQKALEPSGSIVSH